MALTDAARPAEEGSDKEYCLGLYAANFPAAREFLEKSPVGKVLLEAWAAQIEAPLNVDDATEDLHSKLVLSPAIIQAADEMVKSGTPPEEITGILKLFLEKIVAAYYVFKQEEASMAEEAATKADTGESSDTIKTDAGEIAETTIKANAEEAALTAQQEAAKQGKISLYFTDHYFKLNDDGSPSGIKKLCERLEGTLSSLVSLQQASGTVEEKQAAAQAEVKGTMEEK
jgi:hypothetical protein